MAKATWPGKPIVWDEVKVSQRLEVVIHNPLIIHARVESVSRQGVETEQAGSGE
jgi:hypothetical protein